MMEILIGSLAGVAFGVVFVLTIQRLKLLSENKRHQKYLTKNYRARVDFLEKRIRTVERALDDTDDTIN